MAHQGAGVATGGTVADLEVRGIAKRFGSVIAIERVDIDVQRGEFVATKALLILLRISPPELVHRSRMRERVLRIVSPRTRVP